VGVADGGDAGGAGYLYAGPAVAPVSQPREADAGAEGGRGLTVVAALSDMGLGTHRPPA
jgi:hypothetical protein